MNITFKLIAFLLLAPGSAPRLPHGETIGETASSTSSSTSASTPGSSSSTSSMFASSFDAADGSGKVSESFKIANFRTPSGVLKARACALSIKNTGLIPAPQRIVGFKSITEDVVMRNSTPGPFRDYQDYSTRALSKQPCEVRDYQIAGHKDVHVVLTEAYSAALDVKDNGSSEPIKHHLQKRVSPADIPQLLDAMPDSRYFKKVFISDDLNPEDDYVTQTYYPEGFISSMAMTDGQLELYKAERNEYLRRDVLHEWSHQLRYEFWNDKLRKCFEDSVNLELVEWNPSLYATRGAGEQWAVLGERMLGFGGEEFLEACTKAPIRTTIWMRALQKCLSAVPEPNKSIDHDKYIARMQYVEKHVLPKAMKKLELLETTGKTKYLRQQAKGISEYLNVNDWKRISKNLALVFCLESYARSWAKASEA